VHGELEQKAAVVFALNRHRLYHFVHPDSHRIRFEQAQSHLQRSLPILFPARSCTKACGSQILQILALEELVSFASGEIGIKLGDELILAGFTAVLLCAAAGFSIKGNLLGFAVGAR